MTIIEFIAQQVGSIVCEGLVKTVAGAVRKSKPPVISQCELGGIEPETIVVVDPSERVLKEYREEAPSAWRILQTNVMNGWCGELRTRFEICNPSTSVLVVKGISAGQKPIVPICRASILFPGESIVHAAQHYRFLSNLDSDKPSMQLFELYNGERITKSERNYFDETSIDIEPGRACSFEVIFTTSKKACQLKPYVVLELNGTRESYELNMTRDAYLYPVDSVPQSHRYMIRGSVEPPYFAPVC